MTPRKKDVVLLLLAPALQTANALEQNATAAFSVGMLDDFMTERFETTLKLLPAKEAVARVERGTGLTTHVVEFISKGSAGAEHHRYVQDMVDAGLVSVLLNLLGQCDKRIEDVIEMEGVFPDEPILGSRIFMAVQGEPVEGYLHDVTRWIEILCMLVDPNMRVGRRKMVYTKRKIARGVAPLVQCLYDDDVNARVLFRKTEHWHHAHLPFVNLLANLVGVRGGEGYTPEIIPILMEHEGLVEMLIRSIWWSELRPDIMNETSLDVKAIAQIAYYAGGVLEQILVSHEREDDVTVFYEAEGKECSMRICNTIIVNEAYDPSSNTTFALGILDLLKGEKRNGAMNNKHFLGKDEMHNMMTVLLVSGCADPSIFSALISCGDRNDIDYAEAEGVMRHALEITHVFVPGKMHAPTDMRMSAAIEAGLIELMLRFLLQFKNYTDADLRYRDDRGTPTLGLVHFVGMILQSATSVSLRQHCTKAISLRRDSIVAALMAYEKDNGRKIASKDLQTKHEDIIMMIRSMLDWNQVDDAEEIGYGTGPRLPCFDCEWVSQKEKELCLECEGACICGEDCTVEDWDTEEQKEKCSELPWEARRRHVSTEVKNLHRIGSKVMNGNRSRIVVEATLGGWQILDCVVIVDFRIPPLTVKVVPAEVATTADRLEHLFESAKGGLWAALIQRDSKDTFSKTADYDGIDIPSSVSQMLTEHFFHDVTWADAQDMLKRHFAGRMGELERNPKLGEQYLDGLCFEMFKEIYKEKAAKDWDLIAVSTRIRGLGPRRVRGDSRIH